MEHYLFMRNDLEMKYQSQHKTNNKSYFLAKKAEKKSFDKLP